MVDERNNDAVQRGFPQALRVEDNTHLMALGSLSYPRLADNWKEEILGSQGGAQSGDIRIFHQVVSACVETLV